MIFDLELTDESKKVIARLEKDDAGRAKKVKKTLGLLERDPAHRGLHTHLYESMVGPKGEKVRESYVENNTPAAYRVFWYYGPKQQQITILAITPHP